MPPINKQVLDDHRQLYEASCIPSAVEMILKLIGRVPRDYHELQDKWKDKTDGSFADFDNVTIKGVTFKVRFRLPREDNFPFGDLFCTIDNELDENRFVVISLPSQGGWHMFVIYDKDKNGDFLALTKDSGQTICRRDVKQAVCRVKGTDILTYQARESTEIG